MKTKVILGVFLSSFLLLLHLAIIDDYGLTWDFHHHFFAGLKLLNRPIDPELVEGLPFSEPDPRGTSKLPFGPLMSIVPVTTYVFFFEQFKILAFDNAYNLAIVVGGVAGIFFLYLFLLEAKGLATALAGLAFLALLPRYFGDLHNNMKDVPQAAAFTLAIWLFWRLVKYRRKRDLLIASVAFALAFNTKVNTIAVPMIAGAWAMVIIVVKIIKEKKPLRIFVSSYLRIFSYFLLAPLFAFLLWWFFWPTDPIDQLLYIPRFFRDNTQNIEVLLAGKWYCSGVNVPWHYPLWYLAITTPLPTLSFFLIGVGTIIWGLFPSAMRGSVLRSTEGLRKMRIGSLLMFGGKPSLSEEGIDTGDQRSRRRASPKNVFPELRTELLLLLWFFVPIARYIFPQMGVIDGIRHFEEVVFPLSAIAAIGATSVLRFFNNITIKQYNNVRKAVATIVSLGIIGFLLQQILVYHPFQITYFNELVGGIKGALGKYDLDYWGTSQKQAMRWLNRNAAPGSRVYVVMAADVAGKYLRPDLKANLNTTSYAGADYVVVLNRQGFFYRYYLPDFLLRRQPIFVVSNQGIPLTWIFDNKLDQFPRGKQWWTGEDPCIRKYW